MDGLAKDAEAKGEEGLKAQAAALKAALETKDRKTLGEAAGKLEKAVKDVKDRDLNEGAEGFAKEVKNDVGATAGTVFSGDNLLRALYLLISFWVLSSIGMALMGLPVSKFTAGFPIVFILSALAFFVAGNTTVSYYGLEVVFWALLFGLFISNVIGVPEWLKTAVKTEFFIKIGLVLLGAEILFSTIVRVGAYGMVQAVLVISAVFYLCFWVAKKLGLDDEFASILGTAVSICGVSAAIAAGGAIKGDPKKVSHTISLVLLCAIPMLIFQPLIAKVGGDATGGRRGMDRRDHRHNRCGRGRGSIAGPTAMAVAVVVKMAQNVLIGAAAFLLAIWFVFKGKEAGGKPGAMEVWFRFPKFVVGFIVVSVVFSFFMTEATDKAAYRYYRTSKRLVVYAGIPLYRT